MNSRFFLIIISFTFLISSVYSTEINSCKITINSPGYYNLSDNLSSNSYCLIVDSSNVEIDLNGYTISGDGGFSDRGIVLRTTRNLFNVSIKNGVVNNFGEGIYQCCSTIFSSDISISNINFTNNINYDLRLISSNTSVDIDNIMSLSDNYFRYLDVLNISNSFFNGSSFVLDDNLKASLNSSFLNLSITFLMRHNSQMYFYNNIISNNGSLGFIDTSLLFLFNNTFYSPDRLAMNNVYNISIDRTNKFNTCLNVGNYDESSSGYVNVYSDITTTSSCFVIRFPNVVIDLNGHSISGDGGSPDVGILYLGGNLSNVTFMNGSIKNFWEGISTCSSTCSSIYSSNVSILSINFTNNTDYDIYSISPDGIMDIYNISSLYRNFIRYTQEVNVKDSYFNDSFRVFDTNTSSIRDTIFDSGSSQQYNTISNLSYFGNTISSASSISLTSTSQNFYYNFSGELIGNFWGDFSCSNNANNYSVSKSPFSYTICNSTDYLVNSISDLAPLINKSLSPTTQQGNFGQIETGITSLFPFSSILSLSVFMLSLIFFFI